MTLQDAVRQAIADAPRSLRALARAAGVSHVTLLRIRDGDEPVSARVAAKLARVLAAWATEQAREAEKCVREHTRQAEQCARASSRIRAALRGPARRAQ
jgi:transcriptional regulator with XRE-family HTH domain